MSKNFKINAMVAAVAVAAGCMAGGARAQVATALNVAPTNAVVPYVLDSQRDIVKDGSGQCVRTGFWSAEAAAGVTMAELPLPAGCYCDAGAMPQGVCTPPQPVVAAQPAPTPLPAPVIPAPQSEKVSIPADTLFAFDKSELSADGRAVLDDLVSKLKQVNLEAIVAVGHTDRIGSNEYNQRLSERRAASVKTYLVDQGGIAPDRIFIEGRGETQPTGAACDGRKGQNLKACLAPDRRVVIEAVGTINR